MVKFVVFLLGALEAFGGVLSLSGPAIINPDAPYLVTVSSSGGSGYAGVEFTVVLPLDTQAVTANLGAAAADAGKQVECDTTTKPGSAICVVAGTNPPNQTTMADGPVAILTVAPFTNSTAGYEGFALTATTGVDANGNQVVTTAGPTLKIPVYGVYFADQETPVGDIDGVNGRFVLANVPNPLTSVAVYRNGLRQRACAGCNLVVFVSQPSGNPAILFNSSNIPQVGDKIVVDYRYGTPTPILPMPGGFPAYLATDGSTPAWSLTISGGFNTPPASNLNCTPGLWVFDAAFLYVCTAPNLWMRIPFTSF